MTNRNPWEILSAPLPHWRLRDNAGGRVTVVATLGAAGRKSDLGFAAAGDGTPPTTAARAASPDDRRQLAAALGLAPARLVFMEQVHGAVATAVGDAQAGAGLASRATAIPGSDALLTAAPRLALVGLSADCPLVALWDDAGTWCAIAHAGWRGLAAGVLPATVAELARHGVSPDRLRAVVGPHIGPCCYEVREDLVAALLAADRARAEHFHENGGRTFLDLAAVVMYQLGQAGVAPARVTSAGLCTGCRADLLHSYRRDGPRAGRQALAICLKG